MTSRLLVDKIEGKSTSDTIQMPSGYTLQTIINNPDTGGSTLNVTTFTEVSSGMRTSITPKFANSIIYIQFNLLVGCNNATTMRHWRILNYDTSAAISIGSNQGSRTSMHATARHRDHDANDADMMTITAQEVAGTTNARTYSLYCQNESGHSSNLYHHHTVTDTAAIGYIKPMIIIKEIAQ
tara:strand:+ start:119 stop:664 length:546 start_codon:yes stop_codon:yes gene_type:complete